MAIRIGRVPIFAPVTVSTMTRIGRATALALRKAGYRVFGTSRRKPADSPEGVTMLVCDVTDQASVTNAVKEVLAKAGRIDLLVNNAGIGLLGGAEESSTAQAQALFDVNVFGVLRMTNAALPAMRLQGGGRIVNMSSIHELRTFGIRVVLVEPGFTRTAFEENTTRPDRAIGIYDAVCSRMEARMRQGVEGGDSPEIVAATVVGAATDPRPRRRYTAGKLAGQVRIMRRYLPESLVDRNLRKYNDLPA